MLPKPQGSLRIYNVEGFGIYLADTSNRYCIDLYDGMFNLHAKLLLTQRSSIVDEDIPNTTNLIPPGTKVRIYVSSIRFEYNKDGVLTDIVENDSPKSRQSTVIDVRVMTQRQYAVRIDCYEKARNEHQQKIEELKAPDKHDAFEEQIKQYQQEWPLMSDFLF